MAILVDYACSACRGRFEVRVAVPPPPIHSCPACGGHGRRIWAPVGLLRRPGGTSGATNASSSLAGPPLCADNPDVPGLCHMTPSAGRAWVARARGDNRALERELAYQEAATKEVAPSLASVASHHHDNPRSGKPHAHGPRDAASDG